MFSQTSKIQWKYFAVYVIHFCCVLHTWKWKIWARLVLRCPPIRLIVCMFGFSSRWTGRNQIWRVGLLRPNDPRVSFLSLNSCLHLVTSTTDLLRQCSRVRFVYLFLWTRWQKKMERGIEHISPLLSLTIYFENHPFQGRMLTSNFGTLQTKFQN